MADKRAVLKEYFGHSDFRDGQGQIIDSLLSGRDVLCVMPTGAGKSLCYQIPALMCDGVTLVVSPLISLMKDQVASLVQNGVSAAYINSSLSPMQYNRALYNMRYGMYRLVYVAPERLSSPEFAEACSNIKISMVAVDEAHCVSQWGQDFRPGYLKIAEFINSLGYRPTVGAFTATATALVKADIENFLQLQSPFKITTGFDRPNLHFSVIRGRRKDEKLLSLLEERRNVSGIIYCATRKAVEEVCELLRDKGYPATMYHAGLPDGTRRANQDDFVYDRAAVMVATNAFGMGIDKSNVAYVIHYNMPKDIESYYQEAGRAGRDGEAADCILLYSPADVRTNQFLIEKSETNPELSDQERVSVREKDMERLKLMTFYCTTNDCLRSFILSYFGEISAPFCGNCSNCEGQFEETDITVDAQKIMSCIKRCGERFGKKMISEVLRGSHSNRVLAFKLDKLSTYGIMKDKKTKDIVELIDYLEYVGLIRSVDGPYSALKLNASAADVLFGRAALTMKRPKPKEQIKETKRKSAGVDVTLLTELKKLRFALASEKGVPSYVIFSDSTLNDMCRKLPTNDEKFLEINGVGSVKLKRYGAQFMELIKKHTTSLTQDEKEPQHLTDLTFSSYEPWTPEELDRLKRELDDGMLVNQIATAHNRSISAIQSRIK